MEDKLTSTKANSHRHHILSPLPPSGRFTIPPSPGLQKEIAAHRLRQFAHEQADLAQKGWAVRHSELSFGFQKGDQKPPLLPLVGGLSLTGRIDRVDEHPELGWRNSCCAVQLHEAVCEITESNFFKDFYFIRSIA